MLNHDGECLRRSWGKWLCLEYVEKLHEVSKKVRVHLGRKLARGVSWVLAFLECNRAVGGPVRFQPEGKEMV